MRLHVIVEQDEDGYFVAEVPALPGCLSQGNTREEALTNIREAIEGWLRSWNLNILLALTERLPFLCNEQESNTMLRG